MKRIEQAVLQNYVQQEIEVFHQTRLVNLQKINLRDVLKKKNPYLFRAKNITTAKDLIAGMLDARLSSSEEKIFGDFLEKLVLFVAAQTLDGRKSSAKGIDLEFEKEGTWYLMSIKSGHNWGNSSQYQSLEQNFKNALKIQRQLEKNKPIRAVLGMCYGSSAVVDTGLYLKLMGQAFWYFISDDSHLYATIIEPIGYNAQQHTDEFMLKRVILQEQLMTSFIRDFCFPDGQINWQKLVHFNSGNMDV